MPGSSHIQPGSHQRLLFSHAGDCSCPNHYVASETDEMHHEKNLFFCICENKGADQLDGSALGQPLVLLHR